MPSIAPLRAAGSRELKRPRPISPKVRAAVRLMIYPGDDGRTLDFIAAAKAVGLAPDQMRRWLDRPAVVSLIRSERKAHRLALCAGNEAALARERDTAANGMVVVAAVRALEALDDVDASRVASGGATPGITIVIGTMRADAPPLTIDGRSISAPYVTLPRQPEPEPPDLDPVFRAPGGPHR